MKVLKLGQGVTSQTTKASRSIQKRMKNMATTESQQGRWGKTVLALLQ